MKYMSIIHSVHRVLDMKLFNTSEEAENYITTQMKTYNAKIVSDTEWNNDTDPDADIIEREPFYEETGSNKIKTAIIEVDDYDKFGVYELGTNTGEYLGGYVTLKDAQDTALDQFNTYEDKLRENETTYEVVFNDNTFTRCVVIDLIAAKCYNGKYDLSTTLEKVVEEKKEEVEHKLTPAEISAKAAEDAEIRRTLQHSEYETKKQLHEVLSKLSPEAYSKFLEMALVLAKGLEATMETTDKSTENDTVSTDNSDCGNDSTVEH